MHVVHVKHPNKASVPQQSISTEHLLGGKFAAGAAHILWLMRLAASTPCFAKAATARVNLAPEDASEQRTISWSRTMPPLAPAAQGHGLAGALLPLTSLWSCPCRSEPCLPRGPSSIACCCSCLCQALPRGRCILPPPQRGGRAP